MSIDQELPGLSKDIATSKSTYLYDRQIMTLNVNNLIHVTRMSIRANDNHNTR